MNKASIVKCHALLCEIRGALKDSAGYVEIYRELDEVIKLLEKDLSVEEENYDDTIATKIRTSNIASWLKLFFDS